MTASTWWVIRSARGYVSRAAYKDRVGFVLSWAEDSAKALRFPTSRSAHRVRRELRWTVLDHGSVVVRVTRSTATAARRLNGAPHVEGAAS